MKHVVMYSGGIGSWAAAKRVIAQHGKENVILLFTDTLIEDEDLYRFIDETVEETGCDYVRLAEGRTPWEIFKHKRFIGNSRIAQCSHMLKQEPARKWVEENFSPDNCILYLGIDWTETHRIPSVIKNWVPYKVEFPMAHEPYLDKSEMIAELELIGIKQPRLYEMGFAHNNCGGFCVRAGQGHFARLLREMPERFAEHEAKEEEMRLYLGKDVSILKRVRNGRKQTYTLRQLREDIEANQQIDMFDIGGCGCFVDAPAS
ncbi:hypothetical protein [Brevibacillus brevis]|uniref:hypothetical protein n=1 Tax=Brevibacillus brevis TaxID=1393 RepID=UPI00165DB0A4|nr:hypothetical protein [Brevibacillus brevis]